ncbi:MAG: class I SAM-dependent methyltransferase [Pseudomonadota bacterium]
MLLAPIVRGAAALLREIRRTGVHEMPRCREALRAAGVFPIRDHYYEPRFEFADAADFERERPLPGIDWNLDGQLALLERFDYVAELYDVPRAQPRARGFFLDNDSFGPGDAEFWYQLIRTLKPRRIFEIGSGHSTLMAVKAINRNRAEDPAYACRHVCIEPFERPWLEEAGVVVIRARVEELELSLFAELGEDDILFIDSSHVIRPQGDVLFEYLELIPSLAPGVVVHVHDIFSPRDYPERWLVDEVKLWNEQYLLEAFLSHNGNWSVLGALNYLQHRHHDALARVAPFLTPDAEPGSFYMRRTA